MTNDDMERIAAAHGAKAAKIRALNEAGATTTEIAEFLGVSYQHAYSVLLRAGVVGKSDRATASTRRMFALDVNDDGSISLPVDSLELLGVEQGSRVFCRETAEGLLLMSRDAAITQLQRSARAHMPDQVPLLEALLQSDRSPISRSD